jgi:hypothetical protein
MSNSNTTRYDVKDLNWGQEHEHTNIHEEWIMADGTRNIGMGRQIGMGPRHGMSPIPGQQSDSVLGVLTAGGHTLRDMEYSDVTISERKPNSRTRIWGIHRIRTKSSTGYNDTYAFIHDGNKASPDSINSYSYMNIALTSVSSAGLPNGAFVVPPVLTLSSGIDSYAYSAVYQPAGIPGWGVNSVRVRDRAHSFRILTSTPAYVKTSSITVSGVDYKASALFAYSSTRAKYINLLDALIGFTNKSLANDYNLVEVIELGYNPTTTTFRLKEKKIYNGWKEDATNSMPYYGWNDPRNQLTIGLAASYTLTNPDAANVGTNPYKLVRSNGLKQNSSYNAVLIAGENPVIGIININSCSSGTLSGASGGVDQIPPLQYVDPTKDHLFQKDVQTFSDYAAATGYFEDGVLKQTCWDIFPSYTSGTPLPTDAASAFNGDIHFTLGAAGSGILKKLTKYQLSFSLFDKSTNHESNVGIPAKFETGADDGVYLTIYRQTAAPTYSTAFSQTIKMPGAFATLLNMWCPNFSDQFYGTTANNPMNLSAYGAGNIEIRIYYREVGTFEWLPAGRFDFYDLFLDPLLPKAIVCQGAIAALPGPQPGAFNDSTPLQADRYFDVINYQNYAFWMSERNLCYSARNDVLSYPVLNAVPANRGTYRGMIEHAYPGQSVQDSRLMVCTTDAVYVGRFKGAGYFVSFPVRVSATTVNNFDRPGSDFVMDFWTSQVPFSSRSMVVGEGLLYWWGPTGIYRDTGNALPEKLFSMHMEPYINECFDNALLSSIHGVYDSSTKEVIWFYIPKDKTVYTQKALVYNTKHDAFYEYQFKNLLIDWSQYVDAVTNGFDAGSPLNQDLSARRIVIGVRTLEAGYTTTPQRAVFFDTLCNSGDYNAPFQYLATSITAQGGGIYRFAINNNLKNAPVTGKVTISGFKWYAQSAQELDGIWTISGSGAGYVDLIPPTGVVPVNFTATNYRNYFPLYVEAENGFDCIFQSEYHEPYGPEFWGRWTYMWHRYRVELLPATLPQTMVLEVKTLMNSAPASSRSYTLSDNCHTNCALYSQFPMTNESSEGSAVATALYPTGGKWNGGRWYIQSASFDILPMNKENFRFWEG